MTILEHEVRALYEKAKNSNPDLTILALTSKILLNACPFPARVACSFSPDGCLKCWLQEYKEDEKVSK